METKLVAISGSRRTHGNTWHLSNLALDSASRYLNTMGIRTRVKTLESGFDDLQRVREAVEQADGLIFASPVYFGSLSPTLLDTMDSLNGTDMTEKTATSIAIGTQRNGGQETAIEDMWQWYRKVDMTFVGNGPVTSQYGGTIWGGAIGTWEHDEYGKSTTAGTGKRLAQDVLLRKVGKTMQKNHVGTSYLVFTDEQSDVEFDLPIKAETLRVQDMTRVEDCVACAICPPGNIKEKGRYGCIYDDDVNAAYPKFYRANTIICHTQANSIDPRYWMVLNRMRSVRRNDYDLTGRNGVAIGGSKIPLKWLIRQNLPILSSKPEVFIRETALREGGLQYLASKGINPWTEPTHHE